MEERVTAELPGTPWYESNMLWAPASLAIGAVLTLVASQKHDLRWLLLLAWVFLGITVWWIARQTREVVIVTVLATFLIGAGLFWLNSWLGTKQTSAEVKQTPPQGLGPTAPISATAPQVPQPITPEKTNVPKKKAHVTVTPSERTSKSAGVPSTSPVTQTATAPCVAQSNGGSAIVKDCGVANPYKGTVYWTPEGFRITEVGNTRDMFGPFGERVFITLGRFERNGDWDGMLKWTRTQQQLYPDWFTPDAYAGEAHLRLCQLSEATASLQKFVTETEGAPDYESLRNKAVIMLQAASTGHPNCR